MYGNRLLLHKLSLLCKTLLGMGKHEEFTVRTCRVHFKLKSGAYGFTMLEDKEFYTSDARPSDSIPNMASSADEPVDESPSTR